MEDVDNETSRKVIDTGNNKIIMKRTDPYGFITIGFEKGTIPEDLEGNYTSYYEAGRVVEAYLLRKKKAHVAKEVKEAS